MAYEAAVDAGVGPEILDLFEKLCMESDLAWFVENRLVTRANFFASLAEAYDAALLSLTSGGEADQTAAYITAPIITSKAWEEFVNGLETFESPRIRSRDSQSKL